MSCQTKNIILPKYKQFRLLIEQDIRQGKYTLGSALPPERKLVEDYNISRQTVRQALKAMEDDGYLIREQGKGTFVTKLVSGSKANSVNIGVLISRAHLEAQWFFLDLLRGIADAASETTNIVIIPFDADMPGVAEGDFCRRAIENKWLQGVLIATEGLQEKEIIYLMAEDVPLIMTCMPPCSTDLISYVSFNHEQGLEQSIAYLAKLGHTRIAYIGGRYSKGYGTLRMAMAFCKAMVRQNFTINREWIRECDFGTEEAAEVTCDFLAYAKPPTAIVLADDLFAIGVYQMAAKKGLKVPEDLSVIGFNDMSIAPALMPSLTSTRVPRYKMGQLACNVLMRKMQLYTDVGDEAECFQQELDVELIARKSCAFCNDHR